MVTRDERRRDAVATLKAKRGKLVTDWGALQHRSVMVEAKIKKVDELLSRLERDQDDLDTILLEIPSA